MLEFVSGNFDELHFVYVPEYFMSLIVWDFTAFQPDLYADYAHLTSTGADQMSDFLVDPIAQQLQSKAQP